VASSFIVHGIGFCAIALALRLSGVPLDLLALPIALAGFVQLFLLALGVAFVCAAVQVFVRDLAPALPQLLMLWMFASPIFYARASLPLRYQYWFDLNPFAYYPEQFRALLLHSGGPAFRAEVIALLLATVALACGLAVFRRLDPHFEDFL
jgi:ABC-type polysaccharide/polyol phosphate export permease